MSIFGPEPSARGEHDMSDIIPPGFFSRMDRLIEAAEPGSTPIPTAPRANLVKLSNGWGERYVAEEELRGDEWHAVFREAREYTRLRGLVAMIGNRGTGKTRMAAEIVRGGWFPDDAVNHRQPNGVKRGIYRRASQIITELWDKSKRKEETQALFSGCGLLVIDEIQEANNDAAAKSEFTTLADLRYTANLPTIFIGNLDVSGLSKSLSPSVIDRMHENGKAFIFGWESYRRKQNQ